MGFDKMSDDEKVPPYIYKTRPKKKPSPMDYPIQPSLKPRYNDNIYLDEMPNLQDLDNALSRIKDPKEKKRLRELWMQSHLRQI